MKVIQKKIVAEVEVDLDMPKEPTYYKSKMAVFKVSPYDFGWQFSVIYPYDQSLFVFHLEEVDIKGLYYRKDFKHHHVFDAIIDGNTIDQKKFEEQLNRIINAVSI